jgi:hypothetical protein
MLVHGPLVFAVQASGEGDAGDGRFRVRHSCAALLRMGEVVACPNALAARVRLPTRARPLSP